MTAWTNRCLYAGCPHGQRPLDWHRFVVRVSWKRDQEGVRESGSLACCSWECAAGYARYRAAQATAPPLHKEKEPAA